MLEMKSLYVYIKRFSTESARSNKFHELAYIEIFMPSLDRFLLILSVCADLLILSYYLPTYLVGEFDRNWVYFI